MGLTPVTPYLTGEVNSTDRIFSLSAEVALKEKLVENGDTVVITAGVPLGKSGSTNTISQSVPASSIMLSTAIIKTKYAAWTATTWAASSRRWTASSLISSPWQKNKGS